MSCTIDWNTYAQHYDALNELVPYAQLTQEIAQKVDRSSGTPILDAGCGTGNLIQALLAQAPAHAITGVDASSAMRALAREKCPNSSFVDADINEELPFSAETFGTVTCCNVLYTALSPLQTLRELWRILRHDGLLVLVTPKLGYENGLVLKAHCHSTKPDTYWHNAHSSAKREERLIREAIADESLIQRLLFVAAVNRRIARTATFHFFTKEKLHQLLLLAGFNVIEHTETYAQQSHLVVACKTER